MRYSKTSIEESEALSAEDLKLRQMLSDLKKIDAPKDFDFHLKARIANAAPPKSRSGYLQTLRYILPLGAAALIFAVLFVNSGFLPNNSSAPMTAAVTYSETPIVNQLVPTNESPVINFETPDISETAAIETADSPAVGSAVPLRAAEKANTIIAKSPVLSAAVDSSSVQPIEVEEPEKVTGGSRDIAVSSGPKVITPQGINLDEPAQVEPVNQPKNSLSVEQVLSELGVEVVSENGARKVKTIRKNSLADSSGIKVGDVIHAINGTPVSGDPLGSGTIEIKKIIVVRGADKLEIALHN